MKKIMIADDALFMRSVIRNNLETNGYTDIIEAKDGIEAVELYDSQRPDLVLLDITMPGKSGLDALKEIRQINSEAKIVMCSAVGQEMMIRSAIEAGAVDFIVKPFKGEDLVKVVEYCLA